MNKTVFITGGTGYVGSRLITVLAKQKYNILALVRKGSENKIKTRCNIIYGNPLEFDSFSSKIVPANTFIQLVGVSHPSPSKAAEFKKVDLVSAKNSICAAIKAGIKHFIYISVAHPAPIMHEYIKARKEVEHLIVESGMNATIIRPWYILGPGHRWPYLLLPAYFILKRIPSTRETARRLDLITIKQILKTLLYAVENPPTGVRILEAAEIKKLKYSSH